MKSNAVVKKLMERHEYDADQVMEWCCVLIEEYGAKSGGAVIILEQLDIDPTAENVDALSRIAVEAFGIYPWFGEKKK